MIEPSLTLECRGCGRVDRFRLGAVTGNGASLQCPRCGSGVFGPPGLGKGPARVVERRRSPRPMSATAIVPGKRKLSLD